MSEAGASSQKRLSLGLLMNFSSLVALWARRAGRASAKLNPNHRRRVSRSLSEEGSSPRLPPRSPFVTRPKRLLSQISNKAITLVHPHRNKHGGCGGGEVHMEEDEGLWRRGILMGDKCQPLDFSGVIYYDSNGKQLDEVPVRSPRASPLPAYLSRNHI